MESGGPRQWRDGWCEELRGRGCVLCEAIGVEENDWGLRVFVGAYLDAYLPKTGSIRGYVVGVWKGPHLSEPTELGPEEACGYWLETLRVGRAIERSFDPMKMNYETRATTFHICIRM